MRAVVLGAVLLAASAGAAMPREADPSRTAIDAVERLQDTARLYRNGLRTGAPTSALERLLRDLERDLEAVEQAHGAWAPHVPEESRAAVDAERQAIRRGCSRMHEYLRQLSEVLCSDPDDHARMASLAIDVGRQAGSCETALRTVRRLVTPA
jgi:hypothetical protein